MEGLDKIQTLHQIFRASQRSVPMRRLAEELQCSEKTVQRHIDTLRYRLQAPLDYDKEAKGWAYNKDEHYIEIPGIWLTAEELQGLAAVLQVLKSLQNDELNSQLNLVQNSVEALLKSANLDPGQFNRLIKFLPSTRQIVNLGYFQRVCDALLAGRCLRIKYRDAKGDESSRTVSPLQLVYYRENWYLDAWCHKRRTLRSFRVARMLQADYSDTPLVRVPEDEMTNHFADAYGIFAGKSDKVAHLKFTGMAADEVVKQYRAKIEKCKSEENHELSE